MLRASVVFHHARCLQMISLLCLLPLVLSVQTLLVVMEDTQVEQIKVRATVHTPFDQFEPVHVTLERTI